MILGNLYEINSSTSQSVELFVEEENYLIKSKDIILLSGKIAELEISSRIANIQRKITLKDGRVFTSKENDLIDLYLLKTLKKHSFVHKLESHFMLIFISIIITIVIGFSFLKWGIPYFSQKLAFSLPNNFSTLVSENTFDTLDKYVFTHSKLTIQEKEKILKSYKKDVLPFLSQKESAFIKINFRNWEVNKKSIANALALPDGNIILTDEFIRKSRSSEEINSVLFHEIGHIVHRHSLQKIIEGSFITIFIMFITGDATAMSDFGIGIGSILIDTHYSRNHELDADKYAFEKMLKSNINPKNFSSILQRITEETKEQDSSILDYFSSHPNTKERIKISNKYIECFNKGLKECK